MLNLELPDLIARARDGCKSAQGELLGMYANYLRLIATIQLDGMLQQKFSPSDIVQATFYQAQKGIHEFAGHTEREWTAWLRKILASQIAMETRRYSTQARNVRLERQIHWEIDRSSLLIHQMPVTNSESPSAGAMRREQAVVLADALAKLPDHYRDVIVKRHLQGHRFQEIAQLREETVDSVKAIWRRAVMRLRELIGEL